MKQQIISSLVYDEAKGSVKTSYLITYTLQFKLKGCNETFQLKKDCLDKLMF